MQQPRAKLPDRLQFKARKRGRAVEGTGLENRRRGNPFVSSNLTASAMHAVLWFLLLLRLRTLRPTNGLKYRLPEYEYFYQLVG